VSFANARTEGRGEVRCKEQEAEHGEEHPGPDGLQGDQQEAARGSSRREPGRSWSVPGGRTLRPRPQVPIGEGRSRRRRNTPTRRRPISVAEISATLRRNPSETGLTGQSLIKEMRRSRNRARSRPRNRAMRSPGSISTGSRERAGRLDHLGGEGHRLRPKPMVPVTVKIKNKTGETCDRR
jgi:hypothetical protein